MSPSPQALETALHTLALAVAALNRAHAPSEHLWYFAAGSWDRRTFDAAVAKAVAKLPKYRGVEADERLAGLLAAEAVRVLRAGSLGCDADDLVEVVWGG